MTTATDPGSAPAPAAARPAGLPAPGQQAVLPAMARRDLGHPAGSTPARLRRQSIAIVVVALVVGLLVALVISARQATTARIADSDGQVIVAARQFKVEMARADAAAANDLLAGGIGDAEQRATYEAALAEAGNRLEDAARRSWDDDEVHTLLQSMLTEVTTYSGLVEAARANNRQNLPVGAAYLNRASALLTDELLPAADELIDASAERYGDHYNSQFGGSILIMGALVAGAAVLVVLLLRSQLFIHRRFRRVVNPPLAAATLVALALTGWLVFAWSSQASNLRAAHRDGYEAMQRYLDARAAAYTAKGDESRYLIARGSGGAFEEDFQMQAGYLLGADGTGLLAEAAAEASSADEQREVDEAARGWQAYADVHTQVVDAADSGERAEAVRLALEDANEAFQAFATASNNALDATETEFLSGIEDARDALRGLAIGGLVLALVAAILAAWGIQLRAREYR